MVRATAIKKPDYHLFSATLAITKPFRPAQPKSKQRIMVVSAAHPKQPFGLGHCFGYCFEKDVSGQKPFMLFMCFMVNNASVFCTTTDCEAMIFNYAWPAQHG
jgi:hypothetical protein